MDRKQAEQCAREFLVGNVKLSPHHFRPDQYPFYNFDVSNHALYYFFTYPLCDGAYVGGSHFIAVHRKTGEVFPLGIHGE